MRFSVGAVNVRSGNFVYFDSTTHTIRPEHCDGERRLAAGLCRREIDGERYWDGGLISNTPLQWVWTALRVRTRWLSKSIYGAPGDFPGKMAEVETRQKESNIEPTEPTRISFKRHSG